MVTKVIAWNIGTGNITFTYTGSGNGTILVQSDDNNLFQQRSQTITVQTTAGSPQQTRTVTIVQAARQQADISTAVVTAANQTYSGSALTPMPTVTLNGTVVPSTGYDVAYSNNTDAGTATITVTGKGDYTGTATGTFTIAKANPAYTAPAARTNLTYSGSNQYLTTSGNTNHGTIQYSLDGTNWYTTRRQGQNAGSYTSYWRLVGDANHNDVASTSISTTINRASRTISFANTYYVQNTSTTTTRTATPSAGSGDGTITYSISSTTYATINSSTGAVTSKTSDGSATVTATIAEGTNYLSASGSYTLYVFATTHSYSYNGSYRSVTLPPGTYQFQCWGAQGGSNGAYSTYGITAQAGGKGGYSEGQLTVSSATVVRVYVGGQGSSSAGGYNGGGSTSGTSQYNASDELGYSKMGGGGGATDIRLSDGALLSRMIVAGGGSGGAMSYKAVTTSTTTYNNLHTTREDYINTIGSTYDLITDYYEDNQVTPGSTYVFTASTNGTPTGDKYRISWRNGSTSVSRVTMSSGTLTAVAPANANNVLVQAFVEKGSGTTITSTVKEKITTSTTTTSTDSRVGYVGGGTNGGGYSSNYRGSQSDAGLNGSFGQGANQTSTTTRYCPGAGGGGWYGGGCYSSNSTLGACKYSGGGSGWVNTSASSGNRPSGYTGLQLDSGTTYAGTTSFPSTSGGTETGHEGNGYAKITRLS